MVQKVLNDKDTDPLLRHFLLREDRDVGGQGSLCLRKGFAGYAETLKNSQIPAAVNWVDPNNAEAAGQRSIAEGELDKLPAFTDCAGGGRCGNGNRWRPPIGTELACVGWLRKSIAGNWECLTRPDCPREGRLVTVRAAVTSDAAKAAAGFEPVGRLEKGKAAIDACGAALADGRPVFVVFPPK